MYNAVSRDIIKLSDGQYMTKDGFFKIKTDNTCRYSTIHETFYNPVINEIREQFVHGLDDYELNRMYEGLYNMPYCTDLQVIAYYEKEDRKIKHKNGVLLNGDTVKIIKGRKIPVGTLKTFKEIQVWKDKYGRNQTYYAIFTDGTKTNIDNCILEKAFQD